eukprot:1157561-Pelagomonas_calceolata.AAC.2
MARSRAYTHAHTTHTTTHHANTHMQAIRQAADLVLPPPAHPTPTQRAAGVGGSHDPALQGALHAHLQPPQQTAAAAAAAVAPSAANAATGLTAPHQMVPSLPGHITPPPIISAPGSMPRPRSATGAAEAPAACHGRRLSRQSSNVGDPSVLANIRSQRLVLLAANRRFNPLVHCDSVLPQHTQTDTHTYARTKGRAIRSCHALMSCLLAFAAPSSYRRPGHTQHPAHPHSSAANFQHPQPQPVSSGSGPSLGRYRGRKGQLGLGQGACTSWRAQPSVSDWRGGNGELGGGCARGNQVWAVMGGGDKFQRGLGNLMTGYDSSRALRNAHFHPVISVLLYAVCYKFTS